MQSALISATFTDWTHVEQRPRAQLQAALGEAGAIASETAAILAMHGVGSPEFSKEVIDCLPEHPYRVPESEIMARKDCRYEAVCVPTLRQTRRLPLYIRRFVYCAEHVSSSASTRPPLAISTTRCTCRWVACRVLRKSTGFQCSINKRAASDSAHQVLDDGNIEVGVHIADVSFFVRPGTALDAEAQLRSTTV